MIEPSPMRTTLLLLCLGAGCASRADTPTTGPSQRRTLTESQALTVIERTLYEKGTLPARAFPVETELGSIIADVRLTGSPNAIEWVSDEDRSREAKGLPVSRADEPLRIVSARANTDGVSVLVLDSGAYDYETNPQLIQRGAPDIGEAEERLRRDIGEYIEYLSVQGTL
jgi:hypothetical protein